MTRYIGFAAAAAVTAMLGVAFAAEGDQFLIRGDATKGMLEQNMLNVATAEKIAQACVAEATKENVKVSIAIMDQFGEPIYFYRMDGQGGSLQTVLGTGWFGIQGAGDLPDRPSEIWP